jgi:TonB family protein
MQQTTDASHPHLLIQYPLPIVPESISRPYFELDIILFVLNDGSVEKARFIRGSSDASWDSLAIETIKRWRFAPARIDNQPISTWYRLRTTVKYANPQYLSLAEILCTTVEEADSVHEALKKGQDFGELVMQYSVDPSREANGLLGEVDINRYPENIRQKLERLKIDDFTKPIKYGDLYVIFKRNKK